MSDSDMHNKSIKKLEEFLNNMSDEERADMKEHFKGRDLLKGWIDIEEHLPYCTVDDMIEKGYSTYTVKDIDGNTWKSHVADHTVWYYLAKQAGITHWYNE